ncbi:MAG: pyridoxine 5'-phosphate synthase [Spirochaetes bacterium]|nr:pyridoxine 5'-phosphate synthase [Spirochaetota bacterium]
MLLGVNIDHIATLRNARGTLYPSLLTAAGIVEQNGGDFITVHLREDRRHIKEDDLYMLTKSVSTYINLEMACNEDVLKHALNAKPYKITLVPERREELTTEGGLNVVKNLNKITEYCSELKNAGIIVSLFIEPKINEIDLFLKTGASELEIHTGKYAEAKLHEQNAILNEIKKFTDEALKNKLRVCAGHGLNYHNVQAICKIKGIEELNIGHSIISQSIFLGLAKSVYEMKKLIREAEVL